MDCGHDGGAPMADGTLVCLQCFGSALACQDLVSLKCHALAQLRDAWAQDDVFRRATVSSQHCPLLLVKLVEDLSDCCDDSLAEELCRGITALLFDGSSQSRGAQDSQLLEFFLEGAACMTVEHKAQGTGVVRLVSESHRLVERCEACCCCHCGC